MTTATRAARRAARSALVAVLAVTTGCAGTDNTGPESLELACEARDARPLDLAVFGTQVLRGRDAACFRADSGGSYVVAVQLAGNASAGRYGVQVGTPGPPLDPLTGTLSGLRDAPPIAARFETRLRHAERAAAERRRRADGAHLLGGLRRELPAEGSLADFSVLSTLEGPDRFATVTARAAYVGADVIVYVDTAAPTGIGDTEWSGFGALFDQTLFPADRDAFGATSDLDGNGRTIVLFTPIVNALVDELTCATAGFVTGFFYGFDLASTAAGSNQGEVFYAYVPDPDGRFSCRHSVDEVRRTIPATFIHELQHMISFNAHVLQRGGAVEDLWLNEALSHVAEELGARAFEARYPAPAGRTNPARLFPDSATDYVLGNYTNAYRWLSFPSGASVVRWPDDSPGTLEERGAAWLFVRWLEAQRGTGVLRSLVQTPATGAANVSAVAGEPFGDLFGAFLLATSADSLPGLPRTTMPPRFRFGSPSLRRMMFELQQVQPARAPDAWPLAPLTIAGAQRRLVGVPAGGAAVIAWEAAAGDRFRVVRPDNRVLGDSLGLQVSVLRLP